MELSSATVSDLARIVEIYNQAITSGFATADTEVATLESRAPWFESHRNGTYPIYVETDGAVIRGWCSLSPYRPGRNALRFTAEISYYVDKHYHHLGIATRLIQHAIAECGRLRFKTLFAIVLDKNEASIELLKKLEFQIWGHMPKVADFDGQECVHVYLGKRVV